MRRVRSRQRSQSVVEFGLLALLFTLILFGIADFGMLLNGWVAVSSAAREGARRASVGAEVVGTTSARGVIDSAKSFAPVPGVPPSQVKVIVYYDWPSPNGTTFCSNGATPPPGLSCTTLYSQSANPNVVGCTNPPTASPCFTPPADIMVTVTVTADTFEVITPLVRPFFGCGGNVPKCYVPITSSTSMRYEGR